MVVLALQEVMGRVRATGSGPGRVQVPVREPTMDQER